MPNATDTGVLTVEWAGVTGWDRFRSRYGFASPDPSRYSGALRTAAIDGVRVGEWTTTPLSGVGRVVDGPGSALLLAVMAGSLRCASPRGAVEGAPGSIHLLSAVEGTRFTVAERSRFVMVMVPGALLQRPLQAATASSVGRVVSSALTAGLTSLTEAVLDPLRGGATCAAARAVRSMALATIEESMPEPAERDLRGRILDHIDRHLSDPDLTPQSIAAAFGISLRWVHQVFDVDDASVARHIREHRLELVAAQLRSDHRFPRIGALAERTGFGSRDQLTRTFKARFGMTIGDYAERAAAGALAG